MNLFDFLESLKNRNAVLYYFGLANLLAAIMTLLLIFISKQNVMGINAFIKPLKFFLSSTLFVWSMAWYMFSLQEGGRVNIYSWMVVLVFSYENLYIFYRASLGQRSHFNISTPITASLFILMGVAIVILTIWTAYIGYLFLSKPLLDLPEAYAWGIRLGILFFVVFALEGGIMGSNLAHTVGAPDGGPGLPFLNWSTKFGDLRIAHFMGMHALQILPLISFYFLKDIRVFIGFSLVYFLLISFIMVNALLAKPSLGV